MSKGLRVPVGVDSRGKAAVVDSDENNDKIIKIALGDGDNDNAFEQDQALDEDMIFNISDPIEQARIITKITRIFERFENVEKRFRLMQDTIEWTSDDVDLDQGELKLKFRYIDLESDEVKNFEKKYGIGE